MVEKKTTVTIELDPKLRGGIDIMKEFWKSVCIVFKILWKVLGIGTLAISLVWGIMDLKDGKL